MAINTKFNEVLENLIAFDTRHRLTQEAKVVRTAALGVGVIVLAHMGIERIAGDEPQQTNVGNIVQQQPDTQNGLQQGGQITDPNQPVVIQLDPSGKSR